MQKHFIPFQDVIPSQIKALAKQLNEFIDALPQIVLQAYRNPIKLAEATELALHKERLCRCVAFGQQLKYLTPDRNEYGQYGLYGTAAALELLALSDYARVYKENSSEALTNRTTIWANRFLCTWNFLVLAIEDLSSHRESKFWTQAQVTLRNVNVLRSLAAVNTTIEVFVDAEKSNLIPELAALKTDLGDKLSKSGIKKLAKLIYSRIKAAKIDFSQTIPNTELHSSKEDSGTIFCFATSSYTAPTTWNQYLYLSASVLIALIKAYQAQLLTSDEVIAMFSSSDSDRLIKVLQEVKGIDARIKLFTLYALSLLDARHTRIISNKIFEAPRPKTSPYTGIPYHLEIGQAESQWLSKTVVQTTEVLLKSDLLLIDLHIPYDVSLSWLNYSDYFVIPLVPILLELLVRYDSNSIYRSYTFNLLKAWAVSAAGLSEQKPVPFQVLPYQHGEYNGIVNMLYYREAAMLIVFTLEKTAGKGIWLWFYRNLVDRWMLLLIIIVGLAVFVLLYYFWTQSQGTTLEQQAIYLGLISGLLSNILFWGLGRILSKIIKGR